jgi:arginine N-succinyltransferase
MFRLRPARLSDLEAILELAAFLDSPNLPADAAFLRGRLSRAEESFEKGGPPSAEREYQLALEDERGRVLGTSAILSKHGTPGMPHTYLQVGREARESRRLGVRTEHVTLRLGHSTDGPSELGALILHPEARGRPGAPGKLLSWGRFAFIARHRDRFCDEVLAEMRAALDPQGRYAFWEAFGRRFTGLPYEEADRRSATDKDFILELFPDTTFYATLLEPDVLAKLGKVHAEAQPAVRLLAQAGLHWNGQIDPFDAGPFYSAATDDVLPIAETRALELAGTEPPPDAVAAIASVGLGSEFRAVVAPARVEGERLLLPRGAWARLELEPAQEVAWTPLPGAAQGGGGRG